jgi:hypothetical protein
MLCVRVYERRASLGTKCYVSEEHLSQPLWTGNLPATVDPHGHISTRVIFSRGLIGRSAWKLTHAKLALRIILFFLSNVSLACWTSRWWRCNSCSVFRRHDILSKWAADTAVRYDIHKRFALRKLINVRSFRMMNSGCMAFQPLYPGVIRELKWQTG